MFETNNASPAIKLALLEERLLSKEMSPSDLVTQAVKFGVSAAEATEAARKFSAIADNQNKLRENLRSSYDYIVIGSGAAGSVVARRLAEDTDAQVLLLESGGNDLQAGILIPETWFFNQTGPFDWNFSAEPAASVNNRSIVQAAGHVLGGSTSINAMVWARGHKHDFDAWARLSGDESWGYDHVLDIYRRIEDWQGEPDPTRRGTGGEVFVQPAPNPHPIAGAFLKGAESIGIPVFADQNGVMQEGGGGGAITNVRIRDGRRLNVSVSYLYPVMDRPNLTVLTSAHVNRLVVRDGNVIGVAVEWQGATREIGVLSEVIVSAGALQTPKILMLSGIGDRRELARFGIKSVAHLPGVGRNLMDHPIIGAGLWEAFGPVPARNNGSEANLFTKSRADLPTPDLHIFMVEAPYLSEVTARYAVDNVWSISPGLVRPESRGSVRLKSSNPRDPLEIDANMLADPRDLHALRQAMRIARDIGNSAAMKPFAKREILPGPVEGEDLDDLIRNGAMSMHHPTGTARMGLDDLSVVDAQLRVRGVGRLRVADGSIMPLITTGNTQAPCVIIGERMAEILKTEPGRATREQSQPVVVFPGQRI
jgi:choline dehydrogenase